MNLKYVLVFILSALFLTAQQKNVLIFDPNSENADFTDSLNLFYNGNIDYEIQLPATLDNYNALFLLPGSDFNTAHVINQAEGDRIFNYLESGGKVYVSYVETQRLDSTSLWKKIGVEDIVALASVTRIDSILGIDTTFAKDVIFRESYFNSSVPYIIGEFEPILHAYCTPFDFDVVSTAKNDSFDVMLDFFDYIKRNQFLKAVLNNWSLSDISGVDDEEYPAEFSLFQNYPNPFNPTTKIKFSISTSPQTPLLGKERGRGEVVSLKVYDLLGSEVTTLLNKPMSAGTHEIEFDASKLPSGVYYYRLTAGEFTLVKKMMLLK